jgi:hypothetical protein
VIEKLFWWKTSRVLQSKNAPVRRGGFMSSNDSKVTKVQTHFKALSEASPSLNAASDELTKSIALLDDSLKKLNIGLSAWVSFRFLDVDERGDRYDVDQIGYCKVNGTWGIALRHIWGEESSDWHNEEGPWLFHDASREMRLYSVDKIPDVIEALAKEAVTTTKKIEEKTREVRDLAAAIGSIATEAKGKSNTLAERIAAAGAQGKFQTLAEKIRAAGGKGGVSVGVAMRGDRQQGSK